MRSTIIERDPDTGLLVGYVPGFPGAHSQAASMEKLQRNLREVIAMLLEDGERGGRDISPSLLRTIPQQHGGVAWFGGALEETAPISRGTD